MAEPIAPTTAPTTPAPAPESGTPVNARDRSQQLIAKAVKQQARLDAERAKAELEAEGHGDPEATTAPAPGERPRDPKTGHFLPDGAKPKPAKPKETRADAGPSGAHNPATPGATPGPATKKDEPEDKPGPSVDSKARRLVREGKIAEAMQAIGLDPSKLEGPKWAQWRKHNDEREKEIVQAHEVVQREKAEVAEMARGIVNSYGHFVKAKEAFDKADYEEAFQLAFGLDLNSFQRKALQSMTQPGVGKDPVIAELRKEIASLKQEREQERQQMTEAQKQQELHQRRQAQWNANVEAVAESDNPKIAQLAKNQKFMRMVWQKQAESYDQSTDTWLPALEAAEEALEELEREHTEIFGGSQASDVDATRARIPAATGPSGTSARRTAKAVTNLNPAEAAEAAPQEKLKGRALIDKYVRIAKANELRENGV